MDIIKFASSVYLGDRGIKNISINCLENTISLTIDAISRLRSDSGPWGYNSDEDLIDGEMVFTGVKSVVIDPPGYIPNDYISGSSFQLDEHNNLVYKIDSASLTDGKIYGTAITIVASGFHLHDPNRPDLQIID